MNRTDKFNTLMLIGCVLIYLTIWAACNSVFGATRYVSTAGSNTSPYTSWATAATHPNRINAVISTGDTVRIAPATYDTVCIIPPRGGTSWTVYCDSLADGTQRSATILSAAITLSSEWTQRGATSIYRYNAVFPARWNRWETYGMTMERNGVLQHSQTSLGAVTASSDFYYDDATDSIFVYGDPAGQTVRVSQSPVVVCRYDDQDMIKFIGLSMEMGYQGVVILSSSEGGSGDSIWIQYCNLRKAGLSIGSSNLGIIYSGLNNIGKFNKVVGCTLQYAWAPSDDYSGGGGVDFYSQSNFTLDSNYVSDCRAGGFMLKFGGNSTPYGWTTTVNNLIRDNKFVGGLAGIWFGPKQDSLIICGNQFINQTYRGVDAHCTENSNYAYSDVKIFNNTFYNIPQPIMLSPTASGANEVRYNVVFDTTSRDYSILFDVQGGEAPAQTPATDTYYDVDSNMYYHGGDGFAPFVDLAMDCSASNWAQWQACGFDVHGSQSNPNFSASQTPTLTRPGASGEMSRTYGGKTWTIWGALQNEETPCVDPDPPTHIAPGNGATDLPIAVDFDWSDVSNAVAYYLQIAYDPSFNTFHLSSPWTIVGQSDTTINLENGETYYWRLSVQDTCGYSDWSNGTVFYMACTSAAAPTLVSPADEATDVENLVTFTCNAVTGTVEYVFKVSANSDFSEPYYAFSSTDTVEQATVYLENGTTYYWECIAYNDCGGGTYSTSRSFTMHSQADTLNIAYVVEDRSSRNNIGLDTLYGDYITHILGYTVTYLDIDSVALQNVAYYDTAYDGYILGGLTTSPSPTANADSICKSEGGVVAIRNSWFDEINLGTATSTTSENTGYLLNYGSTHWITRPFQDTIIFWAASAADVYGLAFPDTSHEVRPLIFDKDYKTDSSSAVMLVADDGDTTFNTSDGNNIAQGRRVYCALPQYTSQSIDSCQWWTLFGRAVVWAMKDTLNAGQLNRLCFSGKYEIDQSCVVENASGTDSVESYGVWPDLYTGQDYGEKEHYMKIRNLAVDRKVVKEYRTIDFQDGWVQLYTDGIAWDITEPTDWAMVWAYVPLMQTWYGGGAPCVFSATCPWACWTYRYGTGNPVTGYAWGAGGASLLDTDYRNTPFDSTTTDENTVVGDIVLAKLPYDSIETHILDTTQNYGWKSIVLSSTHGDGSAGPEVVYASATHATRSRRPVINFLMDTASVEVPTPTIALSADTLEFSGALGEAISAQNLTVSNSAGGALNCATVAVEANREWLSITPTSGSCPFNVANSIVQDTLTTGVTRYATVTVTCADASNSPQTYVVKLTLTTPTPAAATEKKVGLKRQ